MKKIIKLLKETFIRKHFYLHDYFCQTNTFKECWMVFKHIFTKHLKCGAAIYDYEKLAAKTMGTEHAYSYASGRQSLYAILKALNIGEGDEVIIPGFTCVAVARAIIYRGAIPIYVDIQCDIFNVDSDKLSAKITEKTKAIIVQHTFGNIADVEKIQKLLWDKGIGKGGDLYIIEDFAHAVGCGKLKGDVGFYSSDHTKMISTSTGGMAFTDDIDIACRLSHDRDLGIGIDKYQENYLNRFRILQIAFTFIVETIITHPRIYWLLRPLRILLDKTRIFFFFRDENKLEKPKKYPLRLSNLQAAIGISQLENIDWHLEIRRDFGKYSKYNKINKHQIVTPLREVIDRNSFDEYQVTKQIKEGYVKGIWFNSPVFGCEDLSSVYYEEGSCLVAEKVCKEIINLPIPLR